MAWWGDDFQPVFDLEAIEEDIRITDQGIARLQERMPEDQGVEDDHKIIWSYWNVMCNNLDTYVLHGCGEIGRMGNLEDINVQNMAQGINDDVIYQISPSAMTPTEPYYFGSAPNDEYLYGAKANGNPDDTTGPPYLAASTDNDERHWIQEELDNATGTQPADYTARKVARQNQITAIAAQTSALNDIETDAEDGEGKYPELADFKNSAITARGRCDIASANAAALLNDNSELDTARIDYLDDRKAEITSDNDAVEYSARPVRSQRYLWTDTRCNVSYGSFSIVETNPDNLTRLEEKKARLEIQLAAYESF